jgi:hypothetical protein
LPGAKSQRRFGPNGTPEQREFLRAFLAAHDRKDLETAKTLVDWDEAVDDYKAHFIRVELEGHSKEFIKSIGISPLPKVSPEYWGKFNHAPDAMLAVEYENRNTQGRGNLYPIGEKDGKYLIALQVRQSVSGDWP